MFDYVRAKKEVKVNSSEALNEFEKISKERKHSIKIGETPEWYITQGYMLFQRNYSYNGETVRDAFTRTASRLSRHYKLNPKLAYEKFFQLQWSGKLAPSTPVINNTGLDRGDSVSCSGGHIGDSVHDFYTNLRESAVLSQRGYGTSSYLGDIRPRGTPISTGGKASGVVPVFDDHIQMANKISQGNNRRGLS